MQADGRYRIQSGRSHTGVDCSSETPQDQGSREAGNQKYVTPFRLTAEGSNEGRALCGAPHHAEDDWEEAGPSTSRATARRKNTNESAETEHRTQRDDSTGSEETSTRSSRKRREKYRQRKGNDSDRSSETSSRSSVRGSRGRNYAGEGEFRGFSRSRRERADHSNMMFFNKQWGPMGYRNPKDWLTPIDRDALQESTMQFIEECKYHNFTEKDQVFQSILALYPPDIVQGLRSSCRGKREEITLERLRSHIEEMALPRPAVFKLDLQATTLSDAAALSSMADNIAPTLRQENNELEKYLIFLQCPSWAQRKIKAHFCKSKASLLAAITDLRENGKTGHKDHVYTSAGKGNGGANKGNADKRQGESNNKTGRGNDQKGKKPYLCSGHVRFGDRCWQERCNPKCPNWNADWQPKEGRDTESSSKNEEETTR